MFGLIVSVFGGMFWDGTKHEQEPERAFSNFAAKASAEAVSLEKSHMFLVSAFARLEAFAEGEAQSMFLAAASPRRSASHSFPEMDFF